MLQVSELKRQYDPERQVTEFSVTFLVDRRVRVARTCVPGNVSSLSPACLNELRAAVIAGQAG
jgi:hypothetical protein